MKRRDYIVFMPSFLAWLRPPESSPRGGCPCEINTTDGREYVLERNLVSMCVPVFNENRASSRSIRL